MGNQFVLDGSPGVRVIERCWKLGALSPRTISFSHTIEKRCRPAMRRDIRGNHPDIVDRHPPVANCRLARGHVTFLNEPSMCERP